MICLVQFLAESSRRGYDRIKKSIEDEFGVVGKSAVKTTYQIRKERATIVSGLIDPSRQIYDHIEYEPVIEPTQEERMAANAIKLEKGEKVVVGHTDVKYAALEGDFCQVINHLRNKECKVTKGDPSILKDGLIVINSFDGAVHGETEKKA